MATDCTNCGSPEVDKGKLRWTVYSCPEHGAVSNTLAEYDSKTDTYQCGHRWRKGINGYCKLTLIAHTVSNGTE